MSGLLLALGIGRNPVLPKQDASMEDSDMTSNQVADKLRDELPSGHVQFADAYAQAAFAHAPVQLKPYDFALIHAAIIDRESGAGIFLRPRGPEGVGDFKTRWYNEDSVPNWASELNLYTGNVRVKTETYEDGSVEQVNQIEVSPPAYAGAEVSGWGYGLGQIDFVSWRQWLDTHDWKDPFVNLNKSAEILSNGINRLGDIRYGIASYNAGLNHNYGIGDPDRFTTSGNYSRDVLARANRFGFTKITV